MKYPISHSTHILISLIWAGAIIVVNLIEFYYISLGNIGYPIVSSIVIQNLGIALANSYYNSKIQVQAGPIQMSESTSQAPKTVP